MFCNRFAANDNVDEQVDLRMKAIVCTKYGSPDVLTYAEVEKPAPKDNEVLIRVHAASLNAADWHIMRASPFLVRFMGHGLFKPKKPILGCDVAGHIEAGGKNVTKFSVGDEVFGDIAEYGMGAFAEYVCANEDLVVHKPSNLSFEESAAVPLAAITALQGLRDKGQLKAGQHVLINGASGGVGTFAVQIAKAYGAEVTAVCSTHNADTARANGADHVIDYTKQDFTTTGKQYDIILAANGNRSISEYKRSLRPDGGRLVVAGGSGTLLFQVMALGPFLSKARGRTFTTLMAKANADDLGVVKGLIEGGKVRPVIDRRYSLHEVPEAMRYLEEGHAKGKIVITIDKNSNPYRE